jgi:acyl-CoA synthetase (AMP-forming)/AMP-acid ligase II
VLIVDGRNHYPDDIEATIQDMAAGRVAAISVPDDRAERLVVIVEFTKRDAPNDDPAQKIRTLKRDIISAIANSHGLRVTDVAPVPPGSIPMTTSGKIRRSACAERYRHNEFNRLDVSADLLDETW